VERSLELDKASKGRPRHLEAQYNSTLSPPRSSGAVCLRLDAQATYGVRFRRSTYGWKDIFIELPMAPAHDQMMPESMGLVESNGHLESVSVLHRCLLGC
jgi:hypothetical protein